MDDRQKFRDEIKKEFQEARRATVFKGMIIGAIIGAADMVYNGNYSCIPLGALIYAFLVGFPIGMIWDSLRTGAWRAGW